MDETRAQLTDTWIAELQGEAHRLSASVGRLLNQLHHNAGDTRSSSGGWGEPKIISWQLTDAETVLAAEEMAESGASSLPAVRWMANRIEVAGLLRALRTSEQDLALSNERAWLLETIWRAERWSRFYVVTSSENGHIHSSMNCSTCYPATGYHWVTSLSGKDEAAAVADQGPYLCSVCFPSAPVEHRRDRSDDLKAERQIVRDERAAAKLIKNLADGEQFRDHAGCRITTVHGAITTLRDEVELRGYYGHGPHPDHPASIVAAEKAKEVLLAREVRQPGTGATQEKIDDVIAKAEKKHRQYLPK